MARVKGPFSLSGSTGGMTFYKIEGKNFAREKTITVTKEMIMTSPTMREVRQNISEFGRASLTAKSLYYAIKLICEKQSMGRLYVHLTGLFTSIIKQDPVSDPGMRTVAKGLATPMGRYLLKNFRFNPKYGSASILAADVSFKAKSYRVDLKNIYISGRRKKQATHLKLKAAIVEIDLISFESVIYYSNSIYIPKDRDRIDKISLVCTPLKTSDCSYFVFLHCNELLAIEDEFYVLNGKNNYTLDLIDFKI